MDNKKNKKRTNKRTNKRSNSGSYYVPTKEEKEKLKEYLNNAKEESKL